MLPGQYNVSFAQILYISIFHILDCRLHSPLSYVTSNQLYVDLMSFVQLLEIIQIILESFIFILMMDGPILKW